MPSRTKDKATPLPIRHRVLLAAGRVMLGIAGISLLGAILIGVRVFNALEGQPAGDAAQPTPEGPLAIFVRNFLSPANAPADAPRVGIVAGHAGYDPGAVCPDGLTEADVNANVAQRVGLVLTGLGFQVDLLQEFDPRLAGYRADVLVSIHADSCEVPGASGFKVARVTDSAIPEAEDRLVACLYQEYETRTGLPRHPSSITDNMTDYHAFSEIDSRTPGAIIEMGFLGDDRALLVDEPELLARGIAAGVVCFLEGEE